MGMFDKLKKDIAEAVCDELMKGVKVQCARTECIYNRGNEFSKEGTWCGARDIAIDDDGKCLNYLNRWKVERCK